MVIIISVLRLFFVVPRLYHDGENRRKRRLFPQGECKKQIVGDWK